MVPVTYMHVPRVYSSELVLCALYHIGGHRNAGRDLPLSQLEICCFPACIKTFNDMPKGNCIPWLT